MVDILEIGGEDDVFVGDVRVMGVVAFSRRLTRSSF